MFFVVSMMKILRSRWKIDPVRDKEIIDNRLQLKDLETIETRIAKVQNRHKPAEINRLNCIKYSLNKKRRYYRGKVHVP